MHLRTWSSLGIAASLAALVALLAILPPYEGLTAGLQLDPVRLIAPLRTYLFRNAVINSGWLLLGLYPLTLLFGWAWARLGIPTLARPLLLLPLFLPGALVGMLWRPLFAPWLALAQAELSVAITGVVILWRSVPLAAWIFAQDRRAWRTALPLCVLLILLDVGVVLTLTGGEPYNAAHTWGSWTVQQLWVHRAWGYAASMAGGLALLVALVSWYIPLHLDTQGSPSPRILPGLTLALVWTVGPFVLPLWAFLQAPLQAISTLINLDILQWLVNGVLLWGCTTFFAVQFTWQLPSPRAIRLTRAITLAMLPICTAALAYLAHHWPILRSRWLLLAITTLLTAGLLMHDRCALLPKQQQWRKGAGYALLVIAHSFPLQLVLQLPAMAWTPTLGIVWTLDNGSQSTAAFGAALLLYGAWAWAGAWLVDASQGCAISQMTDKIKRTFAMGQY